MWLKGLGRRVLPVAAYNLYLDGSGKCGDQFVAYAGIVARKDRCLRFAREWGRALGKCGVSDFHSAEFVSGSKTFHRWSVERRQDLIKPLVAAIVRNARAAIGCGVSTADYEAALDEHWKVESRSAEVLCFAQCVVRTLHMVPPPDKLSIWVDQDSLRHQRHIEHAYEQLRKQKGFGSRLTTLAFRDRRKLLPLQAADLVVHQAFQHLTRGWAGQNLIRELFRWVLEGVKHDFRTLDFPYLLKLNGGRLEEVDMAIHLEPTVSVSILSAPRNRK